MSNKNVIKILAIDPGVSRLGWSIVLYHPKNGNIIIKRFGTIEAKKIVSRVNYKEQTDIYGKRFVALLLLQEKITEILTTHKPDYVVAENSFFCSRFPNAFSSLVQVLMMLDTVVYKLLSGVVYKIAPKQAKLIISGAGTANKDGVQTAIASLDKLQFQQNKSAEDLNEHEADSIAVGYAFIMNVLPGILSDRRGGKNE